MGDQAVPERDVGGHEVIVAEVSVPAMPVIRPHEQYVVNPVLSAKTSAPRSAGCSRGRRRAGQYSLFSPARCFCRTRSRSGFR